MRLWWLWAFVSMVACGGQESSSAGPAGSGGASSASGALSASGGMSHSSASSSMVGTGGAGELVVQQSGIALFPTYVDASGLRVFARSGVTDVFLLNVVKTYLAMLGPGSKVSEASRQMFLSTCTSQHVFQMVGLLGPDNYPGTIDARPGGDYEDNATDYIWQLDSGGADQLGEVVEHLLHTVTAVGLRLTFPEVWDYDNANSALSRAVKEAVDAGVFDASSYDPLKGDPEGYRKVLATEYAYWLILAEWNLFETTGKKDEGMTGNGEFSLGTPEEIAVTLPLGHQLYLEHVEKVLVAPAASELASLFP